MKQLRYIVMLAFVAMLTLAPAVGAEDLSDGSEPMRMEMHDMMHQMMDRVMMMPATGAPTGYVLVLLTALGLIGVGALSRFGGHAVGIRYGNRPN